MEYSDKTRPWQWDDRREDWYYYNDTTLQWVYSNGRIYPEPGQARFSAPTPQSSYHQAQPLPGAAPNYDICYRRDVPYHPISPVEHLNAPQSQALYGPQSPSHTYPIQQQSPNGFSVVEPRPQQAIYQSTSPATYAAPRLSHHAAYHSTEESDDDRQRDDQNDRNRHGRSHWQDNNPPTNGGHPTGGDHKDNEEETQGALSYADSQYRYGVMPHFRAPVSHANRMNVSQ